jgi:uncharacterized delta-60 repeat protein
MQNIMVKKTLQVTSMREVLPYRRLFARGVILGLFGTAMCSLIMAGTVHSASSGSLDRTFSRDGKAHANFGEGPVAVALQTDGKIVVVGNVLPTIGPRDFALARFKANGTLDRTFGGNGRVTTNFGPGNGIGSSGASSFEAATAVAIQADGKIVAVGYSNMRNTDFFDFDFALVRYHPDGSLDKTFGGGDGKVTTDMQHGSEDRAFAVAIQPNGKIVVAGASRHAPGLNDFALARYHADGTLDKTFGGDGKVTTDFSAGADVARAVAIQPDGKIVAAGPTTATGRSVDFGLVRYNANGTLDKTFSRDGRVVTDFHNDSGDEAYAMALQPDGNVVVVGLFTLDGITFDFAVARYHSNGTLDQTFSGDGKVITDFTESSDVARAVAIQPDGKIVVAGDSLDFSRTDDFALVRYNTNGTLDATFGARGKVLTDFIGQFGSSESDQADAIAIQADGKIVAVGISGFDGFAVVRYRNFFCNGLDVTRVGTAGNDVIRGTSERDIIAGLDGNDVISGLDGVDVICGGTGDDTLHGGNDADQLFGQHGNDILRGGNGPDTCDGGSGNTDSATSCTGVSHIP